MQITHGGAKYHIRLIDKCDSEFLINLRSDPDVYNNLGTHAFLNSITQDEFVNYVSKADKMKYFIFENENCDKIGLIRMTEIDRVNRSVCVGADIAKEFRGKGLARAIYCGILQITFNTWGMNRAWLLVLESSKIAYELYKKVGFIEEGRQRNAIFKNGKFEDYILMGILQSEFHNNLSI